MLNIFLKVKQFLKTYKKRIITVIASFIIAIIVIAGAIGGVQYSRAKSNIKYTQEQLEKIALTKVPGEVVNVEKELNFKHAAFEYEFKIKTKDNMLEVVKLDSQYGVILGQNHKNDKKQMKENKNGHGEYKNRHKGE